MQESAGLVVMRDAAFEDRKSSLPFAASSNRG
jgi:hypothetical protein